MVASIPEFSQKQSGAYFTPKDVAATLVSWACRNASERMLDPSCGDGQFLALHPNSVGIEQNPVSAQQAIARTPGSLVHEGDFFVWAAETAERFECAAGNPPFIRYQTFKGAMREHALSFCRSLGVEFSGLASSWAPFLVATASLLKPGGRMAFVVPAEIGHAPYSAPLLEYLVDNFSLVQIVAVRSKLFPDLSEDCWLLYADGHGRHTATIRFSVLETFKPDPTGSPPRQGEDIPVSEWRKTWNRRLRPFLLPASTRDQYRMVAEHDGSIRFSDAANIGIGYVSGANSFFHLRPSEAACWNIPSTLLHPTVRNGRALSSRLLTETTIAEWRAADEPIMLLRLPKTGLAELPFAVRHYLDSAAGMEAREAYKCRVRDPWYSVPDVRTPDYFLSYMSGVSAHLVRNQANATCTNSVHAVRVRDASCMARIVKNWTSDFAALSREIEGHPLGGGMLKLEPREAARILIPADDLLPEIDATIMAEAVTAMQRWRHYV